MKRISFLFVSFFILLSSPALAASGDVYDGAVWTSYGRPAVASDARRNADMFRNLPVLYSRNADLFDSLKINDVSTRQDMLAPRRAAFYPVAAMFGRWKDR